MFGNLLCSSWLKLGRLLCCFCILVFLEHPKATLNLCNPNDQNSATPSNADTHPKIKILNIANSLRIARKSQRFWNFLENMNFFENFLTISTFLKISLKSQLFWQFQRFFLIYRKYFFFSISFFLAFSEISKIVW